MSWREAVKFLLFGERKYREFSQETFSYKVDRLTIEVRWKNYRKFRGLLRFPHNRQGLLQVDIAFNPGLDDELFDSPRTLGETVFFVTAEMAADNIKNSIDFNRQRDCPHVLELVIRSSRDVDDAVKYFTQLKEISEKYPYRLNGPITQKEHAAMSYWVSTLAYVGQTGNFFSPLTPVLVVSEAGDKCGAVDYQ